MQLTSSVCFCAALDRLQMSEAITPAPNLNHYEIGHLELSGISERSHTGSHTRTTGSSSADVADFSMQRNVLSGRIPWVCIHPLKGFSVWGPSDTWIDANWKWWCLETCLVIPKFVKWIAISWVCPRSVGSSHCSQNAIFSICPSNYWQKLILLIRDSGDGRGTKGPMILGKATKSRLTHLGVKK